MGKHYIIRDYVGGMNVEKYGLNREFVIKVADLIEDMKSVGFKKLEIMNKM